MKKLLTILLTLVMAVCLVNLNNSHTKAEDNPVNDNDLCFTAEEAGSTIYFENKNSNTPNVQVSTDGTSFSSWNAGDTNKKTLTNVGDKIYVRGNNSSGFSVEQYKYTYFKMSGKFSVSGNIMSLIDEGAGTTTIIPNNYCFNNLFKQCSSIVSISESLLPATTLKEHCYENMFNECGGITSIPEGLLPATTLQTKCYSNMFQNCINLTSIPEGLLPAGKSGNGQLADGCYNVMFADCEKLESIPEKLLPATVLKKDCYRYMFLRCKGLTSIPEGLLPAGKNGVGTLNNGCYNGMFDRCEGITSIPEGLLPATTLADGCYKEMFNNCKGLVSVPEGLLPAGKNGIGALVYSCYFAMFNECTKLTNIPDLPATTFAGQCYQNMFCGCTDLYKGLSESPTTELTEKFTIPTSGQVTTWVNECTNYMFDNTGGSLTVSPDFSTAKTYYRKPKPQPQPQPEPSPSPVIKDESCEKVIGPTWHWNNDKGICEDYEVVGTSTR